MSIQEFSQAYNAHSNPTYLKKERKNNLFLASTMDYFAFFVPLAIAFAVISNRIFYCLFDFEVSSFLRPYSFWWSLFDILIQGNVEFFTFLAVRNILTPFSFDLPTKMLQVLLILIAFLVLVGTFCSYSIYYSEYYKLAKYFLCSMLRFRSACSGSDPPTF